MSRDPEYKTLLVFKLAARWHERSGFSGLINMQDTADAFVECACGYGLFSCVV